MATHVDLFQHFQCELLELTGGLLTGAGVCKQLLQVIPEGQLVAGDQEVGPEEEGAPQPQENLIRQAVLGCSSPPIARGLAAQIILGPDQRQFSGLSIESACAAGRHHTSPHLT